MRKQVWKNLLGILQKLFLAQPYSDFRQAAWSLIGLTLSCTYGRASFTRRFPARRCQTLCFSIPFPSFFFCIQFCHKLLSAEPEHRLKEEFQGKDKDEQLCEKPECWRANTSGFRQKMERETFSDSRATFVNTVQFPSTSSLAPLRLFLLVSVFFVWGYFLLSVCFIACPEPTVTKPKFSHSVHHEGKGHGYYSRVLRTLLIFHVISHHF